MAGVSITFYLSNFILFYTLVDYYLTKYLLVNLNLTKKYFIYLKTDTTSIHSLNNVLIYGMLAQFISTITLKLIKLDANFQTYMLTTYIYFLVLTIVLIILHTQKYMVYTSVTPLFVLSTAIIYSLYFVDNFITFLLVLEIIATVYYFFFIYFSDTQSNLLKLKNLITNYLWLALISLIFFSCSFIFFIKNIGSVNFFEINLFSVEGNKWGWLFILLAISWKVGLPTFHFFKYEIYRYLPLEVIFYFTIFSLIINLFLLLFIVLNFSVTFIHLINFCILIVLCSNFFLIFTHLNNITLFQFLALSGFNTLTTIFLFLIL